MEAGCGLKKKAGDSLSLLTFLLFIKLQPTKFSARHPLTCPLTSVLF